jgi:hypothetical protein
VRCPLWPSELFGHDARAYNAWVSIGSRVLGAVVVGGGAFAALSLLQPEWGRELILGFSAAGAVAGLVFGPKAWQLIQEAL